MSNRVAGPASKTVVVVTGKAKTRLRQVYVAASFMIFPNTQLGRATALRRRLDGVGFRPAMGVVKRLDRVAARFSLLRGLGWEVLEGLSLVASYLGYAVRC